MVRDHLGERLEPVPLDRLLTDDHVGRRTVADTTRIAGRDGAVLGKHGRELGERLDRRLRSRVLVLLERDRLAAALLRRERDRSNLGLECTGIKSCASRHVIEVSPDKLGHQTTTQRQFDAPAFHRC